jgi:heterodisulfide reductase subunit C2
MDQCLEWKDSLFLREVEKRSGTLVSACYQCHKCSTGCPVAPEMDLLSSQVMRLCHLGGRRELLRSRAIWLCASCEACSTRCPMEVDIAGVMDTLRIMAVEENAPLSDVKGREFNRSFLKSVRRHGRVYELGMLAAYKIRSGDFFSDMDKVPKLLSKGKLSLLPKGSPGAKEVKKIFKRAEEEDRNK